MSYQLTNSIYRAIDSYSHPEDATLMKKIQSVRVLFENQGFCRYVPNHAQLRERLTNLLVEALNSPEHRQHIDECYDIALQVGCEIPILQVQDEIYRQHIIEAIGRRNKPMGTSLSEIARDSQNVHNTTVNNRVKEQVIKLCADYPCPSTVPGRFMKILRQTLEKHKHWNDENRKALFFIQRTDGRFGIGHTLFEILYAINSFIETRSDDDQKELYPILNQELTAMSGKCSSGHMSRLVNVVQGFSERYELARVIDKSLIRNVVFGTLTKLMEEECKTNDELLVGIIERSDEYSAFIKKAYDESKPRLLEQFGVEHESLIDMSYEEYITQ